MGTAALAINMLLGLLDRATQIGALISTAKRTGVDITQAQLDALMAADDKARADLQKAINLAKGAP